MESNGCLCVDLSEGTRAAQGFAAFSTKPAVMFNLRKTVPGGLYVTR